MVTPPVTTFVTALLVSTTEVLVVAMVCEFVFVRVKVVVVDPLEVLVFVTVTVETEVPYRKAIHKEVTSAGELLYMLFHSDTELEVATGAPCPIAEISRVKRAKKNMRECIE